MMQWHGLIIPTGGGQNSNLVKQKLSTVECSRVRSFVRTALVYLCYPYLSFRLSRSLVRDSERRRSGESPDAHLLRQSWIVPTVLTGLKSENTRGRIKTESEVVMLIIAQLLVPTTMPPARTFWGVSYGLKGSSYSMRRLVRVCSSRLGSRLRSVF